MNYLVILGGTISGLGKGVTTGAIGNILQRFGHHVTFFKIDPYLNTDAGKLSPNEHGETYVTDDGGEIDLDFGTYERFCDIKLSKDNSITTGKMLQKMYQNYNEGRYNGKTLEIDSQLTDVILEHLDASAHNFFSKNNNNFKNMSYRDTRWDRYNYSNKLYEHKQTFDNLLYKNHNYEKKFEFFYAQDKKYDEKNCICLIEVGGTYNDKEFLLYSKFLEKLKYERNAKIILLDLLTTTHTGEQKVKPIKATLSHLKTLGLEPHIFVCRTFNEEPSEKTKGKILNHCMSLSPTSIYRGNLTQRIIGSIINGKEKNNQFENFFVSKNHKSVFDLSDSLLEQGIYNIICNHLNIKPRKEEKNMEKSLHLRHEKTNINKEGNLLSKLTRSSKKSKEKNSIEEKQLRKSLRERKIKDLSIEISCSTCKNCKSSDKNRSSSSLNVCSKLQKKTISDEYSATNCMENNKISPRKRNSLLLDNNSMKTLLDNKNSKKINIGIIGKYDHLGSAYESIEYALEFASKYNDIDINIQHINTKTTNELQYQLKKCDAILIPGGFGTDGILGKLDAIKYARENNVPFLGICLGFQLAVIEFARNVLGLNVTSEEFGNEFFEKNLEKNGFSNSSPKEKYIIEYIKENQRKLEQNHEATNFLSKTMYLGKYRTLIERSKSRIFDDLNIDYLDDKHRHRLIFKDKKMGDIQENSKQELLSEVFEKHDFIFVGKTDLNNPSYNAQHEKEDTDLSNNSVYYSVFEYINNAYFVGLQSHPELSSTIHYSHPVFNKFVEAAELYRNDKNLDCSRIRDNTLTKNLDKHSGISKFANVSSEDDMNSNYDTKEVNQGEVIIPDSDEIAEKMNKQYLKIEI